MFKLYVEIEKLPASLNKKLRSHHLKNHREQKSWSALIASEVYDKKPKRPLERARLTIIRYAPRFLDFDGLVGSLKPVVDALVSNGILKDDSWGVLGSWQVHQRFRSLRDGPLLEIMVQEVDSDTH